MTVKEIIHANNIDYLRTLKDNSVDSVVTDPPYGISFMGKKWDYDVPSVELWQEVYRVLKPGGHMLVACGTRTQHRMAVNIEDAGFEIRDIVAWVYASGFPKSMNIKKQLEKMLGVYKNEIYYEENISREQKTEYSMRPLWEEYISTSKFIDKEQWEVLQSSVSQQSPYKTVLWEESQKGTQNGEKPCMEGWSYIQTTEGKLQWCKICESTKRIFGNGKKRWLYNGAPFSDGKTFETPFDENGSDTPHRPQSEQQQFREPYVVFIKRRTQEIRKQIEETKGWGTALKPAMELWTLARKPLNGTVAQNILEYGVGGINIDASRVPTQEILQASTSTGMKYGGNSFNESSTKNDPNWKQDEGGRFPANFIYDGSEEVVSLFPDSNGGTGETKVYESYENDIHFNASKNVIRNSYADSGSASRFFYVAKASQEERNFGLYDFEEKFTASAEFRPNHMGKALEGESGNPYGRWQPKKNIHPTVKPIDLMRYLVRMITPPNGICLDPYLGSGTTAIACEMEKFNYIGIELDEQYIEIAKARVDAVKDYEATLDTKTIIKESIKEDKEKELGIQNIFDFM